MAKKYNSNPLPARIGIAFFILGVILGIIGLKVLHNTAISLFSAALIIIGLVLGSYGLTKTKLKDKEFSKFIRLAGKIVLIVFPLLIIMTILVMLSIITFMLFFIFFAILMLVLCALELALYVKTYKYVKRNNPKLSLEEKRKQMIYLGIAIISGLIIWYIYAILA